MAVQERTSFNRRYHTSADKNEQSWLYLDATSLWDLPTIQEDVQGVHALAPPCHSPVRARLCAPRGPLPAFRSPMFNPQAR
jgi:hypothetical protein